MITSNEELIAKSEDFTKTSVEKRTTLRYLVKGLIPNWATLSMILPYKVEDPYATVTTVMEGTPQILQGLPEREEVKEEEVKVETKCEEEEDEEVEVETMEYDDEEVEVETMESDEDSTISFTMPEATVRQQQQNNSSPGGLNTHN